MRKCEKNYHPYCSKSDLPGHPPYDSPSYVANAGRRTYTRYRSFCQGALSGFYLATLLFSLMISPKVSPPSSPILHQPRVGRTTFFLPKPPFRVFGLSKDFLAFFQFFWLFLFFFLKRITMLNLNQTRN